MKVLDIVTFPDKFLKNPTQAVDNIDGKLQGLSVAEAARRLKMSESAVKVGVHRGLKALAAKMRDAA